MWRLRVIVREELREDPLSRKVFVFPNRHGDRVKLLYRDGTGLWMFAKRRPRDLTDGGCKLALKPEALEMILSGSNLKHGMQRAWYNLPD